LSNDIHHTFNIKYILKAYAISIIWGGAILIPVYLANAENVTSVAFFVFLSSILFPFAKLVYDLVIGFKMNKKMEYPVKYYPFLDRFIFFIYLNQFHKCKLYAKNTNDGRGKSVIIRHLKPV